MPEPKYTDRDWQASHAVWLAACAADKRRKSIDTGDLRERYAAAIAAERTRVIAELRTKLDDLGHVDCFRQDQGFCMCEPDDSTVTKNQIRTVLDAMAAPKEGT